jgi:hypothetical protein
MVRVGNWQSRNPASSLAQVDVNRGIPMSYVDEMNVGLTDMYVGLL